MTANIDPDILERIRNNDPGLTSLDLRSQNIDKNDAILLADALKKNRTLTDINLSYNPIGDDGVIVLADVLKKNSVLTRLELWKISIGDVGVAALASMLKDNSTLVSLGFGWNSIGDTGVAALADALITSKNIVYVRPVTKELETHCEENVTIAKDLIERIQNDPGSLTRDDRKEIIQRIPAILYVKPRDSNLSNEEILGMLAAIGIKPISGPATQRINEAREAQRKAALADPSQGI